ncbi:MAG: alpha/beta fold hydrolase [Actinomycetota bacterium]
MTTGFAKVNGQEIFFKDSGGNGPAVILAHGFLMDHSMFDAQVAALSPEFRVITWDERGFGQTKWDGKDFSYWDSARDCLGLMDHFKIKKCVIGGMSQGGFLTMRAALTAPERVTALVLIDTALDNDGPEVLAGYRMMVDTWVQHGPVPDLTGAIANIIIAEPKENAKWIAKWQNHPLEAVKATSKCLLDRDDITSRVGEIKCPALIIHGTADTAISMERAEKMRAGLVGAGPIVKIDGAAHAANLTHPQLVNPPLVEFLRRVTAA